VEKKRKKRLLSKRGRFLKKGKDLELPKKGEVFEERSF